MTKRVIVELIDDLDSSKTADETVSFAIDGVEYEIDLSTDNADSLRGALADYINAGRRTTPGRRKASSAPASTPTRSSEQTQAMRDWGNANGFKVSSRGRIPGEVVAAFNAAH